MAYIAIFAKFAEGMGQVHLTLVLRVTIRLWQPPNIQGYNSGTGKLIMHYMITLRYLEKHPDMYLLVGYASGFLNGVPAYHTLIVYHMIYVYILYIHIQFIQCIHDKLYGTKYPQIWLIFRVTTHF